MATRPYVNNCHWQQRRPRGAWCDGWVTYCMPDAAASVMVDSAEINRTEISAPWIRSLRLSKIPVVRVGSEAGRRERLYMAPCTTHDRRLFCRDALRPPPKGTRGGGEGSRSRVSRISRDGSEEPLPPIGLVELNRVSVSGAWGRWRWVWATQWNVIPTGCGTTCWRVGLRCRQRAIPMVPFSKAAVRMAAWPLTVLQRPHCVQDLQDAAPEETLKRRHLFTLGFGTIVGVPWLMVLGSVPFPRPPGRTMDSCGAQ